jgi:predicted RNA methylase
MNLPSRELFSSRASSLTLTEDVIHNLLSGYALNVAAAARVYRVLDSAPMLYALLPKSTYGQGASIIDQESAIKALDGKFWERLIELSQIRDLLPSTEMKKWDDQIKNLDVPEFTQEAVLATLQGWHESQDEFILDRVDNVFHAFSDTHITNRPEGFSKRLIIKDIWVGKSLDYEKIGPITDLRWLIALLSERKGIKSHDVGCVLDACEKNNGKWLPADGGTWNIRGYVATGTIHIEIHPDMAWQLNLILAKRYPMAIPHKYRKAPVSSKVAPLVLHDLLPMNVAGALYGAKQLSVPSKDRMRGMVPVENGVSLSEKIKKTDPAMQSLIKAIDSVMESIGGVAYCHPLLVSYVFPYDPMPVLKVIGVEGRLPEKHSHQYFATPDAIALEAVAIATEGDQGQFAWGELSAGTGNIARHMPKVRTTCVEISPVHVGILEGMGLKAIQADTISWASKTKERFDRIVINPPYSNNQWLTHTEAAVSVLREHGRLVAILPSGSHRKLVDAHPEWVIEVKSVHRNAFADTGIAVEVVLIMRGSDSE